MLSSLSDKAMDGYMIKNIRRVMALLLTVIHFVGTYHKEMSKHLH